MFGSDAKRMAVRFTAVASAATASLYGFAAPASAALAAPAVGTIQNAGVPDAIPNSYIIVLKDGAEAVAAAASNLASQYGGKVLDNYEATVRGFHARMSETEASRLAADPAVKYVEQDAMIGVAAGQRNAWFPGQNLIGWKPGQRYNPWNPGQPYNPQNPQNPGQPYNPQYPNQPYNPQNPNQPYNPQNPNQPYNPQNPNQPYNPQNPNQPYNPQNPGPNDGYTPAPDRNDTPAPDRNDTPVTANGVTAYVLDTGINTAHSDFGGRATSGYDFVDRDQDANDCNGHGTHVAGTVGGATYGVAKDAKLVGVKVLGCNGSGSFSDFIAGVDWVTEHAQLPAVANMSIGGPRSKALDDAVDRSIARGVTYVIAAGNDSKDACQVSPADTANAITVGAVDSNDQRASFSNYGSCLDLFAPGVNITSASNTSNTGTKVMSGTSMASPHVAGAAALVLRAHPDWTPQQVRDDLVAHAGSNRISDPGAGSPNRTLDTGYLSGAGLR
ncbi:Peptidase inhibitor I9 [Actinoplanes regularis]|uniref:Peptidase inhibitor I9 n=3 Tax=Actinoplanes regularis TaxID=52697 RepID=A0A238USU8_9ACTN|nr:S8 family peptidase [Actinoplanes regularis]SNR25001.1 Peptidase inhibitor I9 [Actinoplanes regularis]